MIPRPSRRKSVFHPIGRTTSGPGIHPSIISRAIMAFASSGRLKRDRFPFPTYRRRGRRRLLGARSYSTGDTSPRSRPACLNLPFTTAPPRSGGVCCPYSSTDAYCGDPPRPLRRLRWTDIRHIVIRIMAGGRTPARLAWGDKFTTRGPLGVNLLPRPRFRNSTAA